MVRTKNVLRALGPGQAVMFVKEPLNPHDPNAVRVRTLAGEDCGFISKELNQRFGDDVYFGHLHSLGQVAGSDILGAEVKLQMGLPPLALDAFPEGMAGVSVKELFFEVCKGRNDAAHFWDRICEDAFSRARGRCTISGLEGQPLVLDQKWRFDEDARTMVFDGLQVLSKEVYNAKHVMEELNVDRRQQGMWMLQAMNEWTPAEAESYVEYTFATAAERSKGTSGWVVDLKHFQHVYDDILPPDLVFI
eukprot:jgi/Botrbrau1/7338/Bobra.247_3s0033.1